VAGARRQVGHFAERRRVELMAAELTLWKAQASELSVSSATCSPAGHASLE
jgi:hypothetical protein